MTENPGIVFPRRETVTIESGTRPKPGPEEVLIETRTTMISTGTELMHLTDSRPDGSDPFPFEPGYNNIGEVIEIGGEVSAIDIGDRVASFGGHRRYVPERVDRCHKVPATVSDDRAVFFTIAEIVMNGIRRGRVSFGEHVAVYGLGLLGQFAVRIAHLAGAQPVFGLDIADQRHAFLPNHSGVIGLNPADGDIGDHLEAATGGRLADVVFEVTGNPDVIPSECDILRELGRLVILGSPRGDSTFHFNECCHNPGYEIIGAHSGTHPLEATPHTPWTKPRHIELYFDYLEADRLPVRPLISHQVPYQDAPDIYQMLLEDRSQALGVIFDWPAAE